MLRALLVCVALPLALIGCAKKPPGPAARAGADAPPADGRSGEEEIVRKFILEGGKAKIDFVKWGPNHRCKKRPPEPDGDKVLAPEWIIRVVYRVSRPRKETFEQDALYMLQGGKVMLWERNPYGDDWKDEVQPE